MQASVRLRPFAKYVDKAVVKADTEKDIAVLSVSKVCFPRLKSESKIAAELLKCITRRFLDHFSLKISFEWRYPVERLPPLDHSHS